MTQSMPRNSKTPLRILCWLAAACAALATAAEACNIPVFRFALERWQPDACELIVFHSAPLSPQHAEFVAQLEAASPVQHGSANTRVVLAPIAALDTEALQNAGVPAVWEALRANSAVQLPWLVARTRAGQGQVLQHWQSSLDAAAAAGLLQSPVRAELCRRLLAGDAVVWLLLKSSDAARTQTARALLQQQCRLLPRQLSLPEGIGLPGSELHSEVPLLLQFSVLEVDPADPREKFLVQLLTGLQPAAWAAGEPLLAPVFGRGRALEVLPANQADAGLIRELTEFLCGACSCQVKEQNPGFDLLLTADWNRQLFGDDAVPPDPAAGTGQQRSRPPVLLPIPPGRRKP